MRKQGGIARRPALPAKAETVSDGLVVYYFHGNIRCPTCRSIESQAQETVQTHFASQLSSGEVTWKILNYEQPAAKPLATKFEIQMPVVVLAKMKDGQVEDWKRLDEVWALVGDKPAFAEVCARGNRADARAETTGRRPQRHPDSRPAGDSSTGR